MKKVYMLVFSMFVFANVASANIEDRADEVVASVQGNHSYHANMARELASIAVDEKGQNEVSVARAFMEEAEKHASMAGGK